MTQYQTFPDAAGDSLTLEKLKVLGLPDFAGKSFLDVGCNEGFFCGFARFNGADRVLGIDHAQVFIDRAKVRFPDCEFRRQDWNALPQERFDVILLASALHYADDQPALIRTLVDRLTDDGVLVIELGIVSSRKAEWRRVKRGIDEREFPSMSMLRQVLAEYAWKWMGPSIPQAGDPVDRHVVHVSRRKPVAYLLMQPPGYGKSSLAAGLFPGAGIPVVSGDQKLSLAARGKAKASDALHALLDSDYSPYRLDKLVGKAFEQGLGPDLVGLWLGDAGQGDIALDVYVPELYRHGVEKALESRGYFPVQLSWDRAGPAPLPADAVARRVEAFYLSMVADPSLAPDSAAPAYGGPAAGHVDEILLEGGKLVIRGWAVDKRGELPAGFDVRLRRETISVLSFDRQLRPDVQRHLGLRHALVGYRLVVDAPGVESADDLGKNFRVAAEGRALTLGAPLKELVRAGLKA